MTDFPAFNQAAADSHLVYKSQQYIRPHNMDSTQPWLFPWEDYYVDTEEEENCSEDYREEKLITTMLTMLKQRTYGYTFPVRWGAEPTKWVLVSMLSVL